MKIVKVFSFVVCAVGLLISDISGKPARGGAGAPVHGGFGAAKTGLEIKTAYLASVSSSGKLTLKGVLAVADSNKVPRGRCGEYPREIEDQLAIRRHHGAMKSKEEQEFLHRLLALVHAHSGKAS